MTKKHIGLTCDLEEITSLFEKSSSLDDFLQAAVSVVAYHMRSAACSIYLFDHVTQMLTLRASQGLSAQAVGQLVVSVNQGLVGRVMKNLQPICVGNAHENPDFVYVEGLGEDKYKGFLAVPIRRQLTGIGVLVVQDVMPDYFDDTDEEALRSIALQLSGAIENANLLMSMHRKEMAADTDSSQKTPQTIIGLPASEGFALGKAQLLISFRGNHLQVPSQVYSELTLADFDQALKQSEEQLKSLQFEVADTLSDVAQLIFSSHLLILTDDEFSGNIRRKIEEGLPPVDAVVDVVNQYTDIFTSSPLPRLQEKVHDLHDLGYRLLKNLIGGEQQSVNYCGQIIVADTLLPSDILRFATEQVEGFVLQGGGAAHIGIICRSLHKPVVMVDAAQLSQIQEHSDLLIDGSEGKIYLYPTAEQVIDFETQQQKRAEREAAASVHRETYTADGTRIALHANINLLSDLDVANIYGAEGVGLYRSEFPFIIRNTFPSEEEQYQVYRRIVDAMGEREVTFRVLDIGGDKMMAFEGSMLENNPFLGLRGIRFLLANKDVFSEQLTAMLRAGAGGNIRIMFPMVSSVDEFNEAKALVLECIERLAEQNIAYSSETKLGVMIELPAAVSLVEDFAQIVDFMSIGTNDLIQYILAVDRTNERVSQLYRPYHPSVLRALKRVASVARICHVDLSVCGDMARNPEMIPFLLGIGIHKLSIAPRRFPDIQNAIESIYVADAVVQAQKMLKCSLISEVEAMVNQKELSSLLNQHNDF